MILRAKQKSDILILELEGQLDFETTLQFKETCAQLMRNPELRGVVFNFQNLKFVGSSGINHFVQVLKTFHTSQLKPKFCNVSSEFQRIFKTYENIKTPFDVYSEESEAIGSIDNKSTKRIGKKRVMTH